LANLQKGGQQNVNRTYIKLEMQKMWHNHWRTYF